MATKLENLPLEIAHFMNVKPFLPNHTKWSKKTITELLGLGIIQVSTAFEQALAYAGGHKVISLDHADLSDGSDAKLTTVRTSGYGKSYCAPVTGLKNKTGLLRVQCYERKLDQFFYFVFPYSSYCHIPSSSNIEIPFEMDGEPRRRNKSRVNWWEYEVANFVELAQKSG